MTAPVSTRPPSADPTDARVDDRGEKVCVIGAGSSGLAAARNLAECGYVADILERVDDLGGNWNYGKPFARVYASTRMISSKPFTQFPDFPMPRELPHYLHHTEVLGYLRAYAAHFGVDRLIEYNTPVERVVPAPGDARHPERPARWDVTLGSGAVRRYAAVVIANGHNWSPKRPNYPGAFDGATLHAAEYRTAEPFRGKRVLVVGGGNSGCDIAVESADAAAATFHSTRRGYHYLPRFLFGRPTDQMGDALLRAGVPLRARRLLSRLTVRLAVGPPQRFGLPRPDHRLFETHPIINGELPGYVRSKKLTPKPDVTRFEGRTVHFADGSAEEVDVVVFATGYNIDIPFIDRALLDWRDGRPRLYLHVFSPSFDTLFVAGLIQPDSGQFGLVHWQTRAVALFLRGVAEGTPGAAWLRRHKAHPDHDLGGGVRYAESTRHFLEVEHWSYRKRLRAVVDVLAGTAAPSARATA